MKPIIQLKHSRQNELLCTSEDLRWATPEIVAKYRAKRLLKHGAIIADIGCGIGFQTFAFAEIFTKVYAVDINKEKIERAESNAKVLGLKNIIFICGDALDQKIAAQISDVDIVFCDPERLPTEEERTLEKIIPNIKELLNLYVPITKKIAIELPPQIKKVDLVGEKEYLSVEGKLNRLTLYLGELQLAERSTVILPGEAHIESNENTKNNKQIKQLKTDKLQEFLLEVDPAVTKAGLVAELSAKTKAALFAEGKNTFFSTNKMVKSSFFCHVFAVLGTCPFQKQEILKILKKIGAGKVILRFAVDPQEYWKLRTGYETQLIGEKKVSLFKFGEQAVVGEEII